MKNLKDRQLIDLLTDQALVQKKPLLGICLGMQLLFTSSAEGGQTEGLGWIPGSVEYMDLDDTYRVPHVGWNDLVLKQPSTMFETLVDDRNFYFVHSYHAVCDEQYVIASFDYGREFTAAVQYLNIVGMQFHPEKSQQNGMKALKQFIEWARGFSHA
jgi:glutamine amidotransferase